MKRIAISVVAVTALVFGWSAASYACGGKTAAKQAEKKPIGTTVVLAVRGVSSQGSADQLAEKISGIKGVKAASVDLAKKQARVTYRPEQVDVKRLLAEMRKLGFEAAVVRRS